MSAAGLLADPGLELVSASRVPMAPQSALERLPAKTVQAARGWERHLIEVITGATPESPPGTCPRPACDSNVVPLAGRLGPGSRVPGRQHR